LATFDPIVILTATYCVASLFLLSGLTKVRHFRVFQATLTNYELVPGFLVPVCAVLLTGLEVAIGCAALFPVSAPFGMFAAAGLLLLYAGAIGANLWRGRRDIDCGCTGPAIRQQLSGWLLLRNLGLVLLAVVATGSPSTRALGAADYVLIALALAVAMALYAAINQLMANAPRLDALDSFMDTA
jgi:uncharacterized membrane protein YphA (DoxX/SURF4 family)